MSEKPISFSYEEFSEGVGQFGTVIALADPVVIEVYERARAASEPYRGGLFERLRHFRRRRAWAKEFAALERHTVRWLVEHPVKRS